MQYYILEIKNWSVSQLVRFRNLIYWSSWHACSSDLSSIEILSWIIRGKVYNSAWKRYFAIVTLANESLKFIINEVNVLPIDCYYFETCYMHMYVLLILYERKLFSCFQVENYFCNPQHRSLEVMLFVYFKLFFQH